DPLHSPAFAPAALARSAQVLAPAVRRVTLSGITVVHGNLLAGAIRRRYPPPFASSRSLAKRTPASPHVLRSASVAAPSRRDSRLSPASARAGTDRVPERWKRNADCDDRVGPHGR